MLQNIAATACDVKSVDGERDSRQGRKRKELLSVSMLYNFLRGDLGFLPVLRQLLHGDERVTERGRRKAGPASKVWFREDRAKGPSSRTLALFSLSLSLQYAIRSL